MAWSISDYSLIEEINKYYNGIIKERFDEVKKELNVNKFEYPLDEDIIELCNRVKPVVGQEISYEKISDVDMLWKDLIDKSIRCLRFFDTREPFLKNSNKNPIAYGIDKLSEYYSKYLDFEGMLYGNSAYYRDHVFHALRTWMLGIFCLLNNSFTTEVSSLIDMLLIDGEKIINNSDKKNEKVNFNEEINIFEKISMWTIIALCHDLGYPLEKSQHIFDKTGSMMQYFVANPRVWADITFNGIQDNINDYIVKFISSKMKMYEKNKSIYHGRIQPKYFLKLSKSLEKYDHGIISAIILYKMMLYFIESDFNLNDDYCFNEEDARQFYIRREILRAIASHTCMDIYHIRLTTFSCLLFICDELQEWGRKAWKNLYAGTMPNSIELKIERFTPHIVDIFESVDMKNTDDITILDNIEKIFDKQFSLYKLIFRDGQDTYNRDFSFIKTLELELKKDCAAERKINIHYRISCTNKNMFAVYFNGLLNTSLKPLEEKINKLHMELRDKQEDSVEFNNTYLKKTGDF